MSLVTSAATSATARQTRLYVSLLAFYTQDEEQLDRLYRRSGLCRQKWLDRPDYRRRTITQALSNLRETYTPDDGARMVVGRQRKSCVPASQPI